MAILRKNGLEAEVTAQELIEIFRALEPTPVVEHAKPHGDDHPIVVRPGIVQAEHQPAPKPATPGGSTPGVSPLRRAQLSQAAHLPTDASPEARSRIILDALGRGPQIIRAFLINKGSIGGNGEEIRQGVNRVQSEVSRSISALRQAETDAQVPAGSFVVAKKEGKLTRWYAGPLLASGYIDDSGPL